ncbi:MAG TPA: aldehyde dehydrogenase family protein [Acidimicrobiales bacterium]|nr:aldehyde dehydrogenase family protein [Acidimicrobiales bacterium]
MSAALVPVGDAIARLRAFHDGGETRSLAWRLACLAELRDRILDDPTSLERALVADLGKHPTETLVTETGLVVAEIDHVRRHLRAWLRPARVPVPLVQRPGRARTTREALGIVLVVSPWNYPLYLALMPLVSAIAAGNCVLVKPSEHAPSSGDALARLLEGGSVGDATAVVLGGADVVHDGLAAGVDHVFFTGSTRVGRVVAEAAARHLTPTTLELGGKCPAIVDATAAIRPAARRIAWAKFVNAGQTCVAPDYVLVSRPVADRFVDELVRAIRAMYGPDPSASPDYPRIVDAAHHDRLAALVARHADRVVAGGEHDAARRYLAPTVLRDPELASDVMREEIFGPILPVVTVEDVSDALRVVAGLPPPLAVYAFSESAAARTRIERGTRSGAFCVNDAMTQLGVSGLPFGGVGESGAGVSHGRLGVESLTQVRSVLERGARPDISVHRPPYSALRDFVVARTLGASRRRTRAPRPAEPIVPR